LLGLAFIINEARGKGDFKIFLEAARALKDHENLYYFWFDLGGGASGKYFYSPLFAVLLFPFSGLPHFIPNMIWLLLNVFFLYRIWMLITDYFKLEGFDSRSKNLLLGLTLLLTIRFIHINFGMIQMTIYLLWSVLESIHFFNNKQKLRGGAILALAINIKILPIVLIPYLVYRNRWKPVLITLVFFLVFLFLPAIFIGFDYNNFLLAEWWKQVNPLDNHQLVESAIGIHSLTALVPSLLHEISGEVELQRHIVNLDLKYATIVLNTVRVLLILFTLYFLRTPPFKPAKSKTHEIWELSYLLLLIPLIFPHQQKYAFVLMLPAVAYVIYFLIFLYKFDHQEFLTWRWKIVILLLILSFILTSISSDVIIGRTLNRITQHYKTITYGALLLLIVLGMCKSSFLDNISWKNPK